jgi:hypothetical protein
MSNLKLFSRAFSMLLFAIATVLAQSPLKSTSPAAAAVSGRALLKGKPARNIVIGLQEALQLGSPPGQVLRATTGEDGRFRFSGIAPGRYRLMALTPGYFLPGDDNQRTRGKSIIVAAGENLENIDINIKKGGVIAGRVIDSSGRPAVKEAITLSTLDHNGKAEMVDEALIGGGHIMFTTNGEGEYRLYGLPEGRYLVSVGVAQDWDSISFMASPKFYTRTFHPASRNESDAKLIEVTEGSETTGVDILVDEPKNSYSIHGRVVYADTEQPVPGVPIYYGTTDGGEEISFSRWNGALSGDNGEFRMADMLPGKYWVFPGDKTLSSVENIETEYIGEAVFCEVMDRDIRNFEIRVRRPNASISGKVVLEGFPNQKQLVDLVNEGFKSYITLNHSGKPALPSSSYRIQPGPDGSFLVHGLSEGVARFQLGAPPAAIRGVTLLRVEQNGVPRSREIDIKFGEQLTGLQFILGLGTITLRGELKVIGRTFPAEQHFFVRARKTDQTNEVLYSGTIDVRGKFQIENMLAGEYELTVSPSSAANPDLVDPKVRNAFKTAAKKIIVSKENQTPVILVVDLTRI